MWIAPVADLSGSKITYVPLFLRSERQLDIEMCEIWALPELRTRLRDMLRGRILELLKEDLDGALCLASDLCAEANDMPEWLKHMHSLRNWCSSLRYG